MTGVSVLFLGDEWMDEREDKMSHVGIAALNGENADASFRDWTVAILIVDTDRGNK